MASSNTRRECIDAVQPVTKPFRRTKVKGSTRAAVPTPRRSVTRREYAELVVRLGSVELQAQRNRATLDLQARRIAELQEQLSLLQAAQSLAKDVPGVPVPPPIPTVES
jgi:hypothetical protein